MNGQDVEPIGLAEVSLVLQQSLGTSRFVVLSFDLKPASDGLLGFMGEHLRLCVKYGLDGETKTMSVFVKSVPRDNASKADATTSYGVFERESIAYTQIFNQFSQVDDSKSWRAKCLLVLENDLIFEDLCIRGFDMLDVKTNMDEEHCLVALTSLARFHAETFILEEKRSKQNPTYRLQDDFKSLLKEGIFAYNTWFENASLTALKLAEKSKRYGKGMSHYEDVLKNWAEMYKQGIQQNSSSKVFRNVASHLDLWSNNMMFRNENGKPAQCVFVDFQCCRFVPPGADLMSFIYINLRKKSRENLTEKLLKHYYRELGLALGEHDIEIGDIFPWNILLECCDFYKKWGMVQSLIIFQFVFLKSELIMSYLNDSQGFTVLFDGPRADLIVEALKDEPDLWDRLMENIDEFIETYVIPN